MGIIRTSQPSSARPAPQNDAEQILADLTEYTREGNDRAEQLKKEGLLERDDRGKLRLESVPGFAAFEGELDRNRTLIRFKTAKEIKHNNKGREARKIEQLRQQLKIAEAAQESEL